MMVNGACDGGRGFGRGCGHDRGCETWSGSSSCRGRDLGRQIFRRVRPRPETLSGSSSCRGRDLGRRIFPHLRNALEWD